VSVITITTFSNGLFLVSLTMPLIEPFAMVFASESEVAVTAVVVGATCDAFCFDPQAQAESVIARIRE
jgi:hypothetical protein